MNDLHRDCLTTTARGYDERNLDSSIRDEGWTVKDGKDYCEACSEEEEKEKE